MAARLASLASAFGPLWPRPSFGSGSLLYHHKMPSFLQLLHVSLSSAPSRTPRLVQVLVVSTRLSYLRQRSLLASCLAFYSLHFLLLVLVMGGGNETTHQPHSLLLLALDRVGKRHSLRNSLYL